MEKKKFEEHLKGRDALHELRNYCRETGGRVGGGGGGGGIFLMDKTQFGDTL